MKLSPLHQIPQLISYIPVSESQAIACTSLCSRAVGAQCRCTGDLGSPAPVKKFSCSQHCITQANLEEHLILIKKRLAVEIFKQPKVKITVKPQ